MKQGLLSGLKLLAQLHARHGTCAHSSYKLDKGEVKPQPTPVWFLQQAHQAECKLASVTAAMAAHNCKTIACIKHNDQVALNFRLTEDIWGIRINNQISNS